MSGNAGDGTAVGPAMTITGCWLLRWPWPHPVWLDPLGELMTATDFGHALPPSWLPEDRTFVLEGRP